MDDLKVTTDWEGDVYCTVKCPSCGIILHPKWQIGDAAVRVAAERTTKRG